MLQTAGKHKEIEKQKKCLHSLTSEIPVGIILDKSNHHFKSLSSQLYETPFPPLFRQTGDFSRYSTTLFVGCKNLLF